MPNNTHYTWVAAETMDIPNSDLDLVLNENIPYYSGKYADEAVAQKESK